MHSFPSYFVVCKCCSHHRDLMNIVHVVFQRAFSVRLPNAPGTVAVCIRCLRISEGHQCRHSSSQAPRIV